MRSLQTGRVKEAFLSKPWEDKGDREEDAVGTQTQDTESPTWREISRSSSEQRWEQPFSLAQGVAKEDRKPCLT